MLFATDRSRLVAHVGDTADRALALIEDAGKTLLRVTDGPDVWETVAEAARGHDGVILVGGHNVLRSRSTNVLPGALRKSLGPPADADAFIVWNDDCYGDTDGDHAAEVPVSRIPDGRDPALLMRALTAAPASSNRLRFGLHNVARPYAIDIFKRIPGFETLIASAPATCGDGSAATMGAHNLYLVLHGNRLDCTSWFGEVPGGGFVKALSVPCIPDVGGAVVLAGACYSALLVDRGALEDPTGDVARALAIGSSIALQLLAQGALAVIGCTGSHYSPTDSAYNEIAMCYTGAPIHALFWQHLQSGRPPAVALFQAKIDYLSYLPYCQSDLARALSLKHWRQFTSLGLGW